MSLGQQHLHARRRLFKNLEPFPARGAWKRFLDYFMYIVGIVAPLAILPQIVDIYSNKSGAGVSLVTWGLLGIVNVLWAFYGIAHRERQIWVSNGLIALCDLAIVIGVLMY